MGPRTCPQIIRTVRQCWQSSRNLQGIRWPSGLRELLNIKRRLLVDRAAYQHNSRTGFMTFRSAPWGVFIGCEGHTTPVCRFPNASHKTKEMTSRAWQRNDAAHVSCLAITRPERGFYTLDTRFPYYHFNSVILVILVPLPFPNHRRTFLFHPSTIHKSEANEPAAI